MTTIFKLFQQATMRLVYDGGLSNAGNMALTLLLSLFPFLLLTATLVGIFGEPKLIEQVLELVFSHWPAGTAAPIANQVQVMLGQASGSIFSFSTLVAMVLATNGLESARDSLNRAYKFTESRSFILRRIQGVFFIIVGALGFILAGAILVGTPVVWKFLVERLPWIAEFGVFVGFLQYGIAAALLIFTLFSFHYFLPDGDHQSGDLIWGILITIIGIVVGSELFAIYLTSYANYAALYAGLAGIMTGIIYLYFLSVLILFGAEFNAALKEHKSQQIDGDPRR
ncbi:MAG: YihY/virulence factor BrkB family protein [Pseudomonadota bacterium]